MQEWTLVLFTLLVQLCVGAFLISGIFEYYVLSIKLLDKFYKIVFTVITSLLGLAIAASFYHLGNPSNAMNIFNNLGYSWLSREVLLVSIFFVFAGIFTGSFYFRFILHKVKKIVFLSNSLIGLVLLFAMSRLYMLPMVPAWNNITTPLSFYCSALVLGAMFNLAAWLLYFRPARMRDNDNFAKNISKQYKVIVVLISIGLVMEILLYGLLHLLLSNGTNISIKSMQMILDNHLLFLLVRLLTNFICIVFFLFLLKDRFINLVIDKPTVVFVPVLFIAASETAGRFIFYASFVNIGS